jgi:uncharacterized protein YdeI (YjbR/CyaY-like superfamily)
MNPKIILRVKDRAEWRKWLADHFDKADEIWLLLPKLSSGEKKIPYNDSVEEALCFGWIDSTGKRLDEFHTVQRFSPRRKGSPYSQSNIERLRYLSEHHLLHPAVEASVKGLLKKDFIFPPDIIEELKKDPVVWKNFKAFSDTYKRIRIAYIDHARDRREEFEKRLSNFIEKTRRKKMFGFGGIEKYY